MTRVKQVLDALENGNLTVPQIAAATEFTCEAVATLIKYMQKVGYVKSMPTYWLTAEGEDRQAHIPKSHPHLIEHRERKRERDRAAALLAKDAAVAEDGVTTAIKGRGSMTRTKQVLDALKSGNLTLPQIAEATGFSRKSVATLIKYLQRAGYIHSMPTYWLSEAGEKRQTFVSKTSQAEKAKKAEWMRERRERERAEAAAMANNANTDAIVTSAIKGRHALAAVWGPQ